MKPETMNQDYAERKRERQQMAEEEKTPGTIRGRRMPQNLNQFQPQCLCQEKLTEGIKSRRKYKKRK
jgi:hypothetical protein